MSRTIDARVIRSRLAMREAALDLLTESDHFSISELLTAAHVTRGTFYRHYCNKQDLVNDVNHYIVRTLLEGNQNGFACHRIVELIAERAPFFHEVFNHQKDTELLFLLMMTLREQRDDALQQLRSSALKTRIIFQWEMMTAAYFAAVSLWLEEGMPFSTIDLVMEFKSLWKGTSGKTKKSAQALFDFSIGVPEDEEESVAENRSDMLSSIMKQSEIDQGAKKVFEEPVEPRTTKETVLGKL
ncbi:TetR/AcrR family transcriptional regulator [Fructobacillus sp. M1-13]|uniref:TetR/AcrR family transcriptional regulator n=1 Tax=Fructobacillus papyriferae TaxID=2713171 RepID=A0ABS5QNR6_9LACO|nr:TetR/AcrR family transcriptional regulator [Fructobacillus papyriferae]MBS9334779.1 TetR/AcrR family transcriptional regulator [Fructobacillus papyriferae]MCD2158769.1 TetR/AcrR family transcriptional regulator [Fructobacillus papyriferae]